MISRRHFLLSATGAACVAGLNGCSILPKICGMSSLPRKPNVIFILCDDLGYGDIGVLFQKNREAVAKLTTPNIDSLAVDGMTLTDHYSSAPVCAPARASLLTGKSQGHCTLRDNQFDRPIETEMTLGSVMQAGGYSTYAVGKWGLGGGGESRLPVTGSPAQCGFDHSYIYHRHLDGHSYYHQSGWRSILDDGRLVPDSEQKYRYDTDLFTARTENYILRHRKESPEKPFFIFLAYTTIHGSHFEADSEFKNKKSFHIPAGPFVSSRGEYPIPAGNRENCNTWIHPDYTAEKGFATDEMRRYATSLRRLDDNIGDLLNFLKEQGIDDETLIVFTSDNGPAAEQGANPKSFESWGPFRGYKRWVTEGGVREPTFVRWQKHVQAGSICDKPSQFQCWMPTLAEVAGLPPPAHSDGISILPMLFGKSQKPVRIYGEYRSVSFGFEHEQFVREGDYVALRTKIKSEKTPVELYNVKQDPKQLNNLAKSEPKLAAKMQNLLLTCRIPPAQTEAACGVKGYFDAVRPYDKAPLPAVGNLSKFMNVKFALLEKPLPWTPQSFEGIAEIRKSRPSSGLCGIEIKGVIEIPETASYSFEMETKTSSIHLWIHEAHVLSYEKGGRRIVKVNLEKGRHLIRILSVLQESDTLMVNLPGISRLF